MAKPSRTPVAIGPYTKTFRRIFRPISSVVKQPDEMSEMGGKRTYGLDGIWLIARADMKRGNVLSWLFGEKLSGRELALNQAARPPRLLFHLMLAMRLLLVIMLFAFGFDVENRLPIVGPWLAAEWWHKTVVYGVLLFVPMGVDWIYMRRAKSRLPTGKRTLEWPQ